MNARPRSQKSIARWLPVGAAGGLLAAVVVAGVISGSGNDGGSPDVAAVTTGTVTLGSVMGTDTVPVESYVAVQDAGPQIVKVPLSGNLAKGNAGSQVQMVQQRLADLAFDPGPVDGQFGTLTTQAVWAFEKLIMGVPRADATGVVTPEMWDRMQDPIAVQPRRPSGGLSDHTEIYLPEQVLVVFHADRPALVAHVSTGQLASNATGFALKDAAEYCETITTETDRNGNLLDEPEEKAICGRSYTPPGVFEANRKVEGVRNGPLGGMYDPIYINQGIAIHGALNIPLEPASHGCIRVSQHLGKVMQTVLELGDRVLIWDGVTEPENQSSEAMKMRWDYADPNATTTTTTTTSTTTTTTTVVPTTTSPVTTTTPKSATTTVVPTTTTSSTVPTGTVAPVDEL